MRALLLRTAGAWLLAAGTEARGKSGAGAKTWVEARARAWQERSENIHGIFPEGAKSGSKNIP